MRVALAHRGARADHEDGRLQGLVVFAADRAAGVSPAKVRLFSLSNFDFRYALFWLFFGLITDNR